MKLTYRTQIAALSTSLVIALVIMAYRLTEYAAYITEAARV